MEVIPGDVQGRIRAMLLCGACHKTPCRGCHEMARFGRCESCGGKNYLVACLIPEKNITRSLIAMYRSTATVEYPAKRKS